MQENLLGVQNKLVKKAAILRFSWPKPLRCWVGSGTPSRRRFASLHQEPGYQQLMAQLGLDVRN